MDSERHLTFDETRLVSETVKSSKRSAQRGLFHSNDHDTFISEEFVKAVYSSDPHRTRRYEHHQAMCHLISLLPIQTLTSKERVLLQLGALCVADLSEVEESICKYYGQDIADTICTLSECTSCNEYYNYHYDYQTIDTLVLLMRLIAQSHMFRPFHVHIYRVYKGYNEEQPFYAPALTDVARRMLTLANSMVKPLMHVLYTRFPNSRKSDIYHQFSRNEFIWMTYYTVKRVSMDRLKSIDSQLMV